MPRSLLKAIIVAAFVCTAGAAQAATVFVAHLSGPAESPPNASPGVGLAKITLTDANTMFLDVSFSGLLSPTSAAHIHAPTATPGTGVAAPATAVPSFPLFPLDVTSGIYQQSFGLLDAATYNPAFVTAAGGLPQARSAFLASLEGGTAYLNIHTDQFGSGEIRGFFSAVPEPETWALMIAGFGLMGAALRSRARAAA